MLSAYFARYLMPSSRCPRRVSNPRPAHYEYAALTAELRRPEEATRHE